MTISEVIAIIIAAASLISALSVIYGKVVRPIKKVVQDVEKSKQQINDIREEMHERHIELKADIKTLQNDLNDQNDYDTQNRAITMKSMIAILDGLEQNGANGKVTKTKAELISYMSKNLNGKK